MASKSSFKIRFLSTRIATGVAASAAVISLWTGIAVTEPVYGAKADPAVAAGEEISEEPIEQDGWRWDPKANEWVLIEEPATEPGQSEPPVIYVERQPVVYTYTYIQEAGTGQRAPSAPANVPAGSTPVAVLPPTVTVVVVEPEPEAEAPAPVFVQPDPPVVTPPSRPAPVAPPPPQRRPQPTPVSGGS